MHNLINDDLLGPSDVIINTHSRPIGDTTDLCRAEARLRSRFGGLIELFMRILQVYWFSGLQYSENVTVFNNFSGCLPFLSPSDDRQCSQIVENVR